MTLSLTLACLWALAANLIAMIPSKRHHWPQAYVLITVGIPIVGYVTYQHGPWVGLIVMAAGVSILRWPAWYFALWVKRQVVGPRTD